MTTCKTITIFEGPDGGGKSYAAQAYAATIGADVVHLGPFPGVGPGNLARLYVEAMLPALQGHRHVVLDRCWLSERPYGQAFRNGKLRLLPVHERMLSRLAWRCGAVLVLGLPGIDVCLANWRARRGEELLQREDQLREVYDCYAGRAAVDGYDLNTVVYDYKGGSLAAMLEDVLRLRPRTHPLTVRSAGNLAARVAIVGEGFGMVKDTDALYQWPFASFSNQGCSRWLTDQLLEAGVGEDQLLWVNADHLTDASFNDLLRTKHVLAFGKIASQRLVELDITHQLSPHPQSWKRFHHRDPYPVIARVRELLAHPKEPA